MSLKKNVIANYLGQAWVSLIGLIFVPVYIHYLGMDAYGLIGVYTLLQAWLGLLDMGMTPTLTREMSRYTAGAHSADSIRDLLRTMEYICFIVALLLGLLVWQCSNWLASHWLQSEKLPIDKLATVIAIIGLVIALRFVEGLYRGAIVGLQQQVWLNITGAVLATLRSGGAVLLLIWLAPSIELFFLWQGVISIVAIVLFIIATYRFLPASQHRPQFSLIQLNMIKRFAGSMMTITLLSLLLTQIDKILLSRLLNLEMFGYYSLANTIALMLLQLITPITQAYYPHFTELVTQHHTEKLSKIYHQSSQLVNILLIPATLILVFFGKNILLLWTNNTTLVENVAPLLTLLALGTMINGFMYTPYFLTLAYAWTKFALYQNIIAVILLAPAMLWAIIHYGAIGAAWVWLILNIGYVLIGVHFMYRRLLTTEKWRWYGNDIMRPLLGTAMATWLCELVQPAVEIKLLWIIWLLITALVMICATWLTSSELSLRTIAIKR